MNENRKVNTKRTILGVSVPIFIMGLVSLFTDISTESIQSFFPLFIISIGGSAFAIGVISGITDALSNILKGLSGWMSDKFNRRKPFILAGYTVSNLSKPLMAFSPSWEYVLGLKAIDRAGKGLRTSARDSLISYYAVKKGRAFGIHRAMDTSGAIIGAILAFILLYFTWTYQQIILFTLIPGLCAIILILFVKDVDPKKMMTLKESEQKVPRMEHIDRNFIKLIIILGVIEFASVNISFLQLRSIDYLFAEFFIPILYLISNVVYMGLSPFMGSLSDKIGRKPVIITGLSILLVVSIILAIPVAISLVSLILIIVLWIMFGFYMAAVDPISRAYIADLVGKDKRGRAYGYYYLSVGLISLGESVIFGLIYNSFSFTFAFIYAAILLGICILIFAITDFSKIIQKK
ncbi:MAG: MFS transporter [Candidatus Lokiarchaeota archaeon]|jgi:MFS family permease